MMGRILWLVWIVGSLAVAGALASTMYIGGSREHMLIGDTTSAHHQIELACDSCHTSAPFASAETVQLDLNDACLSCHKEELEVSNDSHPIKKFKDPRNVDTREQLDALFCTTCHAEHVPEVTNVGAVTLPMDYCSACHQDVGAERESHVGLGFETCATSGCHNFHDNQALYEDFLVKHAGKPEIAALPINPLTALSRAPSPILTAEAAEDPVATLAAFLSEKDTEDLSEELLRDQAIAALETRLHREDAIAPAAYMDAASIDDWVDSGHALAGVNCTGCHTPLLDDEAVKSVAKVAESWIEAPGMDVCGTCHTDQLNTFVQGKHGMRFHPQVSGPRPAPEGGIGAMVAGLFKDEELGPMAVSEARLPMKEEAGHLMIGNCNTCHAPHDVDIEVAAVEACVGCHNDEHTLSYFDSIHHELWTAEMAGSGLPGSGVSCADCHMPKMEPRSGVQFTNHNQNAYLRPSEKMIRPVCMSCHSLEFAIDALADPELVQNNFQGRPSVHIESVDWAVARVEEPE